MKPFLAWYESADKVQAAAKARGFTGKFDIVREFQTLSAAVAWLTAELKETKSVYGTGTIRQYSVPRTRCRACVCGNKNPIHEWTVDPEGIEWDEALTSPCLEDC